MIQLTIYFSSDLEGEVLNALDEAQVDAFLRLGEATGHRFLPPGEIPRTLTWDAVVLVVPVATEAQAGAVAEFLAARAGDCEADPCLRITTCPVELLL